jgi:hypothetical protein
MKSGRKSILIALGTALTCAACGAGGGADVEGPAATASAPIATVTVTTSATPTTTPTTPSPTPSVAETPTETTPSPTETKRATAPAGPRELVAGGPPLTFRGYFEGPGEMTLLSDRVVRSDGSAGPLYPRLAELTYRFRNTGTEVVTPSSVLADHFDGDSGRGYSANVTLCADGDQGYDVKDELRPGDFIETCVAYYVPAEAGMLVFTGDGRRMTYRVPPS